MVGGEEKGGGAYQGIKLRTPSGPHPRMPNPDNDIKTVCLDAFPGRNRSVVRIATPRV